MQRTIRLQEMKLREQSGVAMLVALIALLILTVFGLVAMGDLIIQSNTIRNEQFKQRVFYAASSELNANINTVNVNDNSQPDPIVDALLKSKVGSNKYQLSPASPIVTPPTTVTVDRVEFTASRNDLLGCNGESVGKVKVLAGNIDVSARLNDGKRNRGIRSTQRQRFVYCWP